MQSVQDVEAGKKHHNVEQLAYNKSNVVFDRRRAVLQFVESFNNLFTCITLFFSYQARHSSSFTGCLPHYSWYLDQTHAQP